MSKKGNISPPKRALRFFRWFCHPDYVEDIEGDLLERFEKRTSEKKAARWLFTLEVLKLLRPGIIKNFEGDQRLNHYGVFKHNLKVSYRNLLRRKSYALVNIGGLIMGLTITLLVGQWILDEFSFNKQNDHYDKVARVMLKQSVNQEIYTSRAVPFPLSIELQEQFGDDFEYVVPATWFGDYVLSIGERVITTRGGFMGVGAAELMSLNMVQGNRKGLSEESAVLLSQSVARALFGDEDPIGQTVAIHNGWDFSVSGVFEDISSNSSFHRISFIGQWDFYVESVSWLNKMEWDDNSFQLFVQIAESSDMNVVHKKIARVVYDNIPENGKAYDTEVFLHPLRDWHLRSSWENGVQTAGDIQYVWWFGIIGAFVLILACVNYMNLSTAQSIKRAKEVGVLKSIGMNRGQLIMQFLTESILTVFIAFLMSSMMTYFVLPYFNSLTNKEIVMPLTSAYFWVSGAGFAIVIGLLSGSYPALYLSSFNATQVLKGTYQNTLSAALFRKFLVVFQFTISITLIISTLIISQQINYASQRPLGYDNSGTIIVGMNSPEHWSKNNVIKNDLISSGLVTHFTQSSAPLTEVWTENDDISWEGMDPNFQPWFCTFFVNHNYGKTISWEIIDGRDFSTELASDSSAIIINEEAAKYMQFDDPIGKTIKRSENFNIIGVVKNLLVESPFSEVRPTIYFINRGDMAMFQLIRLNAKIPTLKALEGIETIFKQHVPKVPFNFDFVSDIHDKKFRKIERVGSISQIFAILAILISCLGLFGLASFMIEQRTKEIGIRKVLGAPVIALLRMLSIEFVLLVIISCSIATPLAFFGMSEWLNSYEYRTPMNWIVFFFACFITLLITLITVSFRSMKVVNTNPAKILKDE